MNTCTQSALLIALVCATPTLFAQETSKPSAQIDQLAIFEGSFGDCSGQLLASPVTPPPHATIGKIHGEKSVDGRWIRFSYAEQKTTANATPYHIEGYDGYDASKKQFVSTTVDNVGNYGISYSSGWNGDAMTFEGTSEWKNKIVVGRDVFTRKGDRELTHTGFMQGDDKQWIKTDEETCQRKP